MSVGLAEDLARGVRGKVLTGDGELEAFRRDFGNVVEGRPRAVVLTCGMEDVRWSVRVALERGLPVTVRGAGQSIRGQALSEGGIVLCRRPSPRDAVLPVEDGVVSLDPYATWLDVEDRLNPEGRSSPVLTAHLSSTVGGTLSAAGYGLRSVGCGCQADHVERLRIVTADGRVRDCSASENGDLFRFALAGMGRFGVLERVWLRTVRYERTAVAWSFPHGSHADLVAFMGERLERTVPDMFFSFNGKGDLASRCLRSNWMRVGDSRDASPTASDGAAGLIRTDVDRIINAEVVRWASQFPTHRRLLADFVLDYEGVSAFAEFIDRRVRADPAFRFLEGTYLLIFTRHSEARDLPLAAHHLPHRRLFGIGLYFMVPDAEAQGLVRVRALLSEALELCVSHGGRPYQYGWHEMTPAQRAELYGDDLAEAEAVKRRYDPDGVFGPLAI